ncbi:MAG TPA: Ig-like domain-containing protein [Candidatus Elarobacter sp.]|nr:Ig-like domain-containing protein [Candidatus Elarobacter sp.]
MMDVTRMTSSGMRATGALALLLVAACASPGVPPGGPERHTPPMITRIEPDTNMVNVRGSEFVIHFDEVISERPAGATTLEDIVLISPRDGAPAVDWHRTSISLHPSKGWRANTAYTVTLLPGIADLRGNVRATPTQVTFSTGPTIPSTQVRGIVFDWLTGAPVAVGIVELRPATDTSLAYVAATDTLGHFTLRGLRAGSFRVRGFLDQNRNRGLDPGEPFDTVTKTLADSLSLELYVFAHDSLGPRLGSVTVQDSVTLHANFDSPLDPRVPLDPARFVLVGPDSARIALRVVRPATVDTTTAKPAAPPPRAVTPSAVPIPQPRVVPPRVLPKPNRPLLFRDVIIVTATPLRRGATYRLQVIAATGPTGKTLTSERTFQIPALPPRSDSARVTPARPTPTTSPRPLR